MALPPRPPTSTTPSAFRDMFLRLPPAAAVFLLSSLLGGLVDGHALSLPRQTKTIEPHELNVVSMWAPLPTAAPLISPLELFRRQTDNTICGYLGGDSALPATCSAGSHCVLDEANKVMGCCPNSGSCTTGVFTGCVDRNSGAQTEVNPYVYTCSGANVCYKNSFPGGFFQYGCGSASNLATSVQTAASGQPSIPLIQTSISLTQSPSSLSQSSASSPSSSQSASSSSASSTNAASSSSSTPASSSPTSSASPSPTNHSPAGGANSPPAAPPASGASSSGQKHTGAIVGGVLGGLAGLAILAALLFCCLRRRQRRNRRLGPGPDPMPAPTSEYMSPVRSHGAAFAPLPTWQEEEEPQTTPPNKHAQPYHQWEHPANAATGMGNTSRDGPLPPLPVSAVSAQSPTSPTGGHGGFGGNWPLPYGAAHVAGGGSSSDRGHTPIANEYTNNYNTYYNGSHAGAGAAVVTPLTPYQSHNPHSNSFSNSSYQPGHGLNNNSAGSREIDDFSRDVGSTMRHVQDEDTTPLTAGTMHHYPDGSGGGVPGATGGSSHLNVQGQQHQHNNPYQNQPPPGSSASMGSTSSYTPSRRGGNGDRPLWQQTRRQSRNMMWL
ncbi:hypothetical protein PG989_005949 [Apiospora arundinis]|uniref:Uncharacterized protein n=1 Tax=Apiospora arundinis TaxID=335852 RepID=A0ABR2IUN6_9PEZI